MTGLGLTSGMLTEGDLTLMSDWKKARKKPVVVEFREVKPPKETVETLEGTLTAYPDKHVIIKGVKGELYPCEKGIFAETYEVLEAEET